MLTRSAWGDHGLEAHPPQALCTRNVHLHGESTPCQCCWAGNHYTVLVWLYATPREMTSERTSKDSSGPQKICLRISSTGSYSGTNVSRLAEDRSVPRDAGSEHPRLVI